MIAESFERIHRSNLSGWACCRCSSPRAQSAKSLGLSGQEIFEITGLAGPLNAGELPRHVTVNAGNLEFQALVRIDTPEGGGLLPPRRDPAVRAAAAGRRLTTADHAWRVRDMPRHHGDPFDRLLVAQAQAEGLALLTRDAVFDAYDVDTVWG